MYNRIIRYHVCFILKPLSFGVTCYAAPNNQKQQKTPGGLGGSEHRLLKAWKSGAEQHCTMKSWGEIMGIMKHRGRQYLQHKEQLEQEDFRATGGD